VLAKRKIIGKGLQEQTNKSLFALIQKEMNSGISNRMLDFSDLLLNLNFLRLMWQGGRNMWITFRGSKIII